MTGVDIFAGLKSRGVPVLRIAVSIGQPATVSVLLAAGADETARSGHGGRVGGEAMDSQDGIHPATQEAIVRMLERGPAFRAVSWRWETGMNPPDSGTGGVIAGFPGGQPSR